MRWRKKDIERVSCWMEGLWGNLCSMLVNRHSVLGFDNGTGVTCFLLVEVERYYGVNQYQL